MPIGVFVVYALGGGAWLRRARPEVYAGLGHGVLDPVLVWVTTLKTSRYEPGDPWDRSRVPDCSGPLGAAGCPPLSIVS